MKKLICLTFSLSLFPLIAFAQTQPNSTQYRDIQSLNKAHQAQQDAQPNIKQNRNMGLQSSWPVAKKAINVPPNNKGASNNLLNIPQNPSSKNSSVITKEDKPSKPPIENKKQISQSWSNTPDQELRQSGGHMRLPTTHGIADSKNHDDMVNLGWWTHYLMSHGVTKRKIMFEAHRLDRQAFDLWASRFKWYEDHEHPNSVVVEPSH